MYYSVQVAKSNHQFDIAYNSLTSYTEYCFHAEVSVHNMIIDLTNINFLILQWLTVAEICVNIIKIRVNIQIIYCENDFMKVL